MVADLLAAERTPTPETPPASEDHHMSDTTEPVNEAPAEPFSEPQTPAPPAPITHPAPPAPMGAPPRPEDGSLNDIVTWLEARLAWLESKL
jgi:hypothetical protein